MAPDFEYVIRFSPGAVIGHSLRGTILFDLPVGVLVLWYFHRFLKRPLAALPPSPHCDYLASRAAHPFAWSPAPRALLICAALLLGTATHLLWDGFTHANGWAVSVLTLLAARPFAAAGLNLAVYRLLQHVSSVVGLLALAVWYLRWLRAQPPIAARTSMVSHATRSLAAVLLVASICLGGLASVLVNRAAEADFSLRILVGHFAVGCLAGCCAGLVLLGWIVALREPQRAAPTRSAEPTSRGE
jgi:hypothetical protein